ncbi:MAG: bifunctional diaminohydroxyphosphoribosylaminopyrimidine deaminase/5-amino-6-(5-phosphoribosylamino)uracil reductase RibD [Candidatus Rokubacteria bacterium]|nr:bifunctional diaminohydroxyphosphoribosylaminopyrimidine deaminase/5-amino-6-(5-phosphoribosylamino)uracil reductase RibD [Candidatus Rokubacteria bacterium]
MNTDAHFMRRALALAEQARGLTSPNPLVGAVVVSGGEIVGEGFHRAVGQPHAEVEALEVAGVKSRGGTLYVTLEPCMHHGRTPPCVPRVLAAGIARVVVAVSDANPLVAGGGIAALRAAGVEVTEGVMAEEARRQNRAFLHAMRAGRPHVTLKGAITLDGKIADVHGTSRWITGREARERAHRLRAECDAIVVGVETVRRDDPELTVRLDRPWPREPYRVVLDSRARMPVSARLLRVGTPARVLVAVAADAPAPSIAALEARGATVVRCPGPTGRIDPRRLLDELHRREVRAVLVEGGAEVHAAFLDAALVDRVAVFVAPALLGGRGAPSLVGGSGRTLKDRVALDDFEVTRLGPDVLLEADVAGSRH